MSNQFVHLRFHSEYSITDGIVRLDPILETAAERGQVALGITDNMNVFGGLRFYTHAIADGIKPIVGSRTALPANATNPTGSRFTARTTRATCRSASCSPRPGWKTSIWDAGN